jgi:hypothetical protein
MTEEIKLPDRKTDRHLPKREIPILDKRNVGTDQGKHGKEDKDRTGSDMLSEFAHETVIACSHNPMY